jgi:hypothetical protein
MTTTKASTNLAMAMRLPATDPHTRLHVNTWGQLEKEFEYLGLESIDAPAENHLDQVEPSIYEVLDLGADVTVLPYERSRMLVRGDYDELRELIEKDRHTPGCQSGGMVVTGHPGIGTSRCWFLCGLIVANEVVFKGKSFFLFYYLFKNLLAAQPTVLQTEKNGFLLFIEDGVYLIRFSSSTTVYDIQSQLRNLGCKKGIVALVDSSEKSPSPAPVFTDSRLPFYTIQATAPHSSRWEDWLDQRSASVVVMKPCSWTEIYIIG